MRSRVCLAHRKACPAVGLTYLQQKKRRQGKKGAKAVAERIARVSEPTGAAQFSAAPAAGPPPQHAAGYRGCWPACRSGRIPPQAPRPPANASAAPLISCAPRRRRWRPASRQCRPRGPCWRSGCGRLRPGSPALTQSAAVGSGAGAGGWSLGSRGLEPRTPRLARHGSRINVAWRQFCRRVWHPWISLHQASTRWCCSPGCPNCLSLSSAVSAPAAAPTPRNPVPRLHRCSDL